MVQLSFFLISLFSVEGNSYCKTEYCSSSTFCTSKWYKQCTGINVHKRVAYFEVDAVTRSVSLTVMQFSIPEWCKVVVRGITMGLK